MRDDPGAPREKLQQSLYVRLICSQTQKVRAGTSKHFLCGIQVRLECLRVLPAQPDTRGIHPNLFAGFGIGYA